MTGVVLAKAEKELLTRRNAPTLASARVRLNRYRKYYETTSHIIVAVSGGRMRD